MNHFIVNVFIFQNVCLSSLSWLTNMLNMLILYMRSSLLRTVLSCVRTFLNALPLTMTVTCLPSRTLVAGSMM